MKAKVDTVSLMQMMETLAVEAKGELARAKEAQKMWIVMNGPMGLTDLDRPVFDMLLEVLKWHQSDVGQALMSLHDIQVWAVHKHLGQTLEDTDLTAEKPILSAGQPRSMTTRKFRQLTKKHTTLTDTTWIEVFNLALEMQWWMLLMLRSITGAIEFNDFASALGGQDEEE